METYQQMYAHLEAFVFSFFFSPPLWLFMGGIYIAGWIVGAFMRGQKVGNYVILFYFGASIFAFITKSQGWDMLILCGFPFVLGLYIGKKER